MADSTLGVDGEPRGGWRGRVRRTADCAAHPNAGGARARTQIRRTAGGQLIATVEINPYGDFTELLAHELEHVIEQLDGIDLAAKATVARSGVRNCADGTFETSRAVRVGTLVALEARRER